jgi:hypothetical protein
LLKVKLLLRHKEGKTTIKPLAKIIQVKKKLNSPNLIAGFTGAGLVGSISTSYIINRLHMKQIACVESEFIVPGVIYAEGKLRHPFRLYSNERGDVRRISANKRNVSLYDCANSKPGTNLSSILDFEHIFQKVAYRYILSDRGGHKSSSI